jgi:hypothetical protein
LTLSVVLTSEQYAKIHRVAAAEDRSAASIVRRLISAMSEAAPSSAQDVV